MMLFKKFMLVGGMPKAVEKYIDNDRNFYLADVEKEIFCHYTGLILIK